MPQLFVLVDNFNGITVHLKHRDITMVAASLAPFAKLAAHKERMSWTFPWLSSVGSDFNFDLGVSFTEDELETGNLDYNYRPTPFPMSEAPSISEFLKDDDGAIFHTYSTYARGLDMLNVAYHYMDVAPMGRDEGDTGQSWARRHDEYSDRCR